MTQKSTLAIIGIGRVGLPLALFLAQKGHQVFGIDRREDYVASLASSRQMPFREVDAQPLLETLTGERFFPTTDLGVVATCQVIIVTIGTPIDEHMNPVLRPIEEIFRELLPHLRSGQTILLRSTVSPGTTEFLATILAQSALELGKTLFLAFCPERIAQGHSLEELPEIPQIVGGLEPASTEAAAQFFQDLGIRVHRTDALSAELSKLFCNMYRYIDFAIANEFMMIASEYQRNIYEIVSMINDGYRRGGIKLPGLTGGPCLYKDGFFLIEKTPYPELISNAWKINESVPAYLIGRIEALKPLRGARVGLFGLAFKRDNDDTRNSLSYKFLKIFRRKGAQVVCHDPYLRDDTLREALSCEVLVFATNHSAYSALSVEALKLSLSPEVLICDPWNLFGTRQILFRLSEAKPPADSGGCGQGGPWRKP